MDFDRFPYELIYSFLLPLPYSSIMDFCLTNQHYYLIWKDINFWATKSYQTISKVILDDYDIIKVPFPYQEFSNTSLSPSQRYLQLLASENKVCERGSEQCVDINHCATLAAYRNNRSLVEYFINKGATDLKLVTYYAILNNNIPLVNYLLTLINLFDPIIFSEIIRAASIAGNRDLVIDLINNNTFDNYFMFGIIDECRLYACENNHLQLVEDLFNITLKNSYISIGHSSIIPLLVTAYMGNIMIIDYLITKYTTLYIDDVIIWACFGGQLKMVEYLINLNKSHYDIELFNRCLKSCLTPHNIGTLKLILPHGPSKILEAIDIAFPTEEQLNKILFSTTKESRFQVLKYLISKGATDINGALKLAYQHKLDYVINYLQSL